MDNVTESMHDQHEGYMQKGIHTYEETGEHVFHPHGAVETVYSPCRGRVEKVFIHENSYIYEWEKLLTIRTEDGKTEEVSIGISGSVASIEVEPGERVDTHTVLCKVEDDLGITGCDQR